MAISQTKIQTPHIISNDSDCLKLQRTLKNVQHIRRMLPEETIRPPDQEQPETFPQLPMMGGKKFKVFINNLLL